MASSLSEVYLGAVWLLCVSISVRVCFNSKLVHANLWSILVRFILLGQKLQTTLIWIPIAWGLIDVDIQGLEKINDSRVKSAYIDRFKVTTVSQTQPSAGTVT